MVKHIVLFKLKDGLTPTQKQAVALRFKQAIEALPEKVECIGKIEVGVNMNPKESWDVALYSEFDSLEQVNAYAAHPDHVAAAGILAGMLESRSCVDYEG